MSKLKIYDHANYVASVVKLPVKQKVEGLDNLVMVEVFGNKCLIGKDSPEDQLYLFFPSETQIAPEFLRRNNLYRESQLNFDVNSKGFFEANGRVKAIKFKGIVSSGFVIPVQSLITTGFLNYEDEVSAGDEFNEINGHEVCRKYFAKQPQLQGPRADKEAKVNNRLSHLLIPNQFRFHHETEHLAKHLSSIKPNDIVVLTDKWHGSSCILSQVFVAKQLSLWEKFVNLLGGQIPNRKLAYIYSSGKPKSKLPKGIEGDWINDGPDFYTSNIWKRALEDYKHAIEPGISIYSELVGFEQDSNSYIQKGYDYGCIPFSKGGTVYADGHSYKEVPGQYRMVVYRITYTKPDGGVIEFTQPQIKEYCKKYNMETVKELYYGPAKGLLDDWWGGEERFGEALFQSLQERVEIMGFCKHCTTLVPAEGIVLRKDGGPAYKLKASHFLKKESDDADKGETNIEDNA